MFIFLDGADRRLCILIDGTSIADSTQSAVLTDEQLEKYQEAIEIATQRQVYWAPAPPDAQLFNQIRSFVLSATNTGLHQNFTLFCQELMLHPSNPETLTLWDMFRATLYGFGKLDIATWKRLIDCAKLTQSWVH